MSARVLVVDDIPVNVRLLEAKLSAEYYDVVTASGGREALEKIAEQPPDIILLDVMMPEMDGFEVCAKIKSDPTMRHIPVVMVTALNEQRDRVRGLEAGADDFLTKPVNDVALLARVKSLLRVKMMMDELRLREETSRQLGALDPDVTGHEPVSGVRILVVEDDQNDAAVIMSILEENNDVLVVDSPDDALREAETGYDLIIVSLGLLDHDALRLCSQLRSGVASRHSVILILIDEQDDKRLAKALELGVNDYLAKSIDRSELLARVRTQLSYKRYHDQLRGAYQESVTMALTDSLTGLHNRRYVTSHLETIVRNADGVTPAIGLLMVDIDHFKLINDEYGHVAGDEVLKEVARRLQEAIRGHDLAARLGGEEFLAIISEVDTPRAEMVAERLRKAIFSEPIRIDSVDTWVNVSVSVGVALRDIPEETPESQLARADHALYEAKRTGRNRVVLADPAASTEESPNELIEVAAAAR